MSRWPGIFYALVKGDPVEPAGGMLRQEGWARTPTPRKSGARDRQTDERVMTNHEHRAGAVGFIASGDHTFFRCATGSSR
jgi:hypothetical protein